MSSFLGSQPSYQPTIAPGQTQANYSTAETGISNLPGQNLPGQVLPLGQQTTSNLYFNPYAMGLQQGANTAAPMGQTAATAAFGGGLNTINAGMGLLPGASAILQQGFDPQNALYNRTLQRVQDQSNVQNAMSGVATTPYGAGVTDQTMANFNIDWQNNLLSRMSTAGGAAGSLVGAGANAIGAGSGIANAAAGQYAGASAMPYSAYQGIGADQMSNLSNLLSLGGGAQSLANLPITDLMSLMGVGNQANQVAANVYQTQVGQQQNQFNQMMKLGQGLGGFAGMMMPGGFTLPSMSFLAGGLGGDYSF